MKENNGIRIMRKEKAFCERNSTRLSLDNNRGHNVLVVQSPSTKPGLALSCTVVFLLRGGETWYISAHLPALCCQDYTTRPQAQHTAQQTSPRFSVLVSMCDQHNLRYACGCRTSVDFPCEVKGSSSCRFTWDTTHSPEECLRCQCERDLRTVKGER